MQAVVLHQLSESMRYSATGSPVDVDGYTAHVVEEGGHRNIVVLGRQVIGDLASPFVPVRCDGCHMYVLSIFLCCT
jgi:hypothetical protein